MAETSRSTVFGRRKEPHTVIIARGDDIRHFQVHPWLVAAGGSAFTLGLTFARLIADAMAEGPVPALAPLSPARFEHLNGFMG